MAVEAEAFNLLPRRGHGASNPTSQQTATAAVEGPKAPASLNFLAHPYSPACCCVEMPSSSWCSRRSWRSSLPAPTKAAVNGEVHSVSRGVAMKSAIGKGGVALGNDRPLL